MDNIKLNLPKKSTFWIAVVVALAGGVLYSLQCLNVIAYPWVYPLTYLLTLAAFVLLVLGLILKGF